jgi:hypothetical protein
MNWLAFIILALVIDVIELGASFGVVMEFNSPIVAIVGYLVISLLLPIANTFLVTLIAGKQQATFAKCFCITSAFGLGFLILLTAFIPPDIDGGKPADRAYVIKNIIELVPWFIGFVLQILGPTIVSPKQKVAY